VVLALAVLVLLGSLISTYALPQRQLLDSFETLEGWQAIPSAGSKITLASDEGKSGLALRIEFELPADFGYVIVRKQFEIDLPADYQFSFDIRAQAPINNLEFKLIDPLENVYWLKETDMKFPAEWKTIRVKKRHIGFAWGPAPGRELRRVSKIEFAISKGSGGKGRIWIDNLTLEPISPSNIPRGLYPKYLSNQQAYWTVIGVNADAREALVNEYGQIEVDRRSFSLEPFLFVDGKLVTWDDVTTTQALLDGYLPIPEVRWNYKDEWFLTVQAVAEGAPGSSQFGVKYTVECKRPKSRATLFVTIRPFQVNPPWQHRGTTRIHHIEYASGLVRADEKIVIPLTKPTAFGASDVERFYAFLSKGAIPPDKEMKDESGSASGVLRYDFDLKSEQTADVILVVPFYSWSGSPKPNMPRGNDRLYYDRMRSAAALGWKSILDKIQITLPPPDQSLINTLKSNLAYILINSDGPSLQPGSRNYERAWIRDGSLTAVALLQTGNVEEAREFIDWYATFQYPDGRVPAIVDARGRDPIEEHDSHGQLIYAIMQYFQFTKELAWLRGKWENVVRAVRFIQSLRSQRKTEVYRSGSPQQRACYGLVPESASHEGYLGSPKHSYWDDFFILRGLKDATIMAGILGEKKLEEEFAAERDDFRKDFYASIRLATQIKNINYVPGCVELGDFDATSTTVGLDPADELGQIPEPQLHNTFEKYWENFLKRKNNEIDWKDYTPYEVRVIGSFIRLDQKQRALEALDFFMEHRRPPGWNHWAEVVHRDPLMLRYIGDMPHTWVGSDFMRSVRSIFVYERDAALVVGAGFPERWLVRGGIVVKQLPTYYGKLNLSMKLEGEKVIAELSGDVRIPSGKIILKSPRDRDIRSVVVNAAPYLHFTAAEVILQELPARVELHY
jgi:hypothetical protein